MFVEDVEVAMEEEEAEREDIRFKLDGGNLYWKYDSDFEWIIFTGGSGGAAYRDWETHKIGRAHV